MGCRNVYRVPAFGTVRRAGDCGYFIGQDALARAGSRTFMTVRFSEPNVQPPRAWLACDGATSARDFGFWRKGSASTEGARLRPASRVCDNTFSWTDLQHARCIRSAQMIRDCVVRCVLGAVSSSECSGLWWSILVKRQQALKRCLIHVRSASQTAKGT
jgi:hypothetical protein